MPLGRTVKVGKVEQCSLTLRAFPYKQTYTQTVIFTSFILQLAFILQNNVITADGFVASLTLGFKEGSVIGVFAVDYMTWSSVTEIDIYNVLNAEVETGMLTDGVDYIGVDTLSLSSIESK